MNQESGLKTTFTFIFASMFVGIADEQTLQLMNTPRCGMPDNDMDITGRNKRYTLYWNKWFRRPVTWDILTYTEDLPRHVVDWQIERAFQVGY